MGLTSQTSMQPSCSLLYQIGMIGDTCGNLLAVGPPIRLRKASQIHSLMPGTVSRKGRNLTAAIAVVFIFAQ